jgi:N-acyl-D-amino-acid deacylase
LHHSGGWDRRRSGDPNGFSERVAERMGVRLPISPQQLTHSMLGRPLDFAPGTDAVYSNFGYAVLGLIIERVTGRPYEESVRAITLHPLALDRVRLDRPRGDGYFPGEAHRYGPRGFEDRRGGHLPITMASGGWIASTVDMVRFLTALDGSRGKPFLSEPMLRAMTAPPPPPMKPRPDGTHFGLGWDRVHRTAEGVSYRKNGGLLGAHTWIEHTADGIDWALFWNGGRLADDTEESSISRQVFERVREVLIDIDTWPEIDLFARAPARPGS